MAAHPSCSCGAGLLADSLVGVIHFVDQTLLEIYSVLHTLLAAPSEPPQRLLRVALKPTLAVHVTLREE